MVSKERRKQVGEYGRSSDAATKRSVRKIGASGIATRQTHTAVFVKTFVITKRRSRNWRSATVCGAIDGLLRSMRGGGQERVCCRGIACRHGHTSTKTCRLAAWPWQRSARHYSLCRKVVVKSDYPFRAPQPPSVFNQTKGSRSCQQTYQHSKNIPRIHYIRLFLSLFDHSVSDRLLPLT
jgi:hypothetical protein